MKQLHPFNKWHDETAIEPLSNKSIELSVTELVRIERKKAWNAALEWAEKRFKYQVETMISDGIKVGKF